MKKTRTTAFKAKRKIRPFILLKGAKLEGDEKSNERVIRGGAVELNKGWELIIDPPSPFIVFRQIVGDEITGKFVCKCFKSRGKCQLRAKKKGKGTIVECKPAAGSNCQDCGFVLLPDDPEVVPV